MGAGDLGDKIDHKVQELGGKAKQQSTDPATQRKGKREEMGANLKQAADKVKDAFKD